MLKRALIRVLSAWKDRTIVAKFAARSSATNAVNTGVAKPLGRQVSLDLTAVSTVFWIRLKTAATRVEPRVNWTVRPNRRCAHGSADSQYRMLRKKSHQREYIFDDEKIFISRCGVV